MKRSIPQVVGSLCASSLVLAAAGQIRADITNGFSSASNWTLNGTTGSTSNGLPAIAGGDLELTSNSANEDSSAWYNTQQNIADSWTASFTYQMSYTTAFPSQGFMFVLQNAGKNALGSGGSGQLGYTNLSPSQVSGGAYAGLVNVNPSWGLGFELFGHGASSFLQLGQNGAFGPGIDNPNSSTLVMSRDTNPINFTISYYQPDGVVNISATDPTAATSLNYNVQLPGPYNMVPTPSTTLAASLGQNTAYVGFTGATGGDTAEQDFTNFSFTSGTPTSPPSGYTAPTPAPAFVTVTRSPIALTSGSFNADVVVENTASLPAGATVSSSIATAAGVSHNALYEAGLSVDGSAVQGGLPTSHEFLSNGDGVTTFQFQHYTNTNNVLRLTSTVTSGTMTLSQPKAFSTLAILAMSAGAKNNSVGAVTLDFANGQTVTTDYAALDWFSGNVDSTTPDGNPYGLALSGFGRITITSPISATSVNGLPSYPDLYETVLNMSHLGIGGGSFVDASGYGALDSLTFNLAASGTSTAGATEIFAVSGSAAVPEPASLGILSLGAAASLLLLSRKRRKA